MHLPKGKSAKDRRVQRRVELGLLAVAVGGFLWSLSHVLSFDLGFWWTLSLVFTVLNAFLAFHLGRPVVRRHLEPLRSRRRERLAAERNRRATEWMLRP